MSGIKTVKTVVSTVMVAVAVGFVMQYSDDVATEPAPEAPRQIVGKVPVTLMRARNDAGEAVFGVPEIETTAIDASPAQKPLVAVDAVYAELSVPPMGTLMAAPRPGCAATMALSRQTAAMVALSISAPCHRGDSFVILHEGMRIAGITDGDGAARLSLPALSPQADFYLRIANVELAQAQIFVPELRQYDRAILEWRSGDNLRLHAFENGAGIGDAGHVWSASIHGPEDTRAGRHGFVRALGDTAAEIPYLAEVYTFPEGQMGRDGGVDLQIGVNVTAENCGREVDARTIQTNAGERLVKAVIAAQMPGCDQIGEVAFLQGEFTDLTHAAADEG